MRAASSQQKHQRVFGLDILRASAILMVVYKHTHGTGYLETLLAQWGVELFFALSGFIIGTLLIKQVIGAGFDFKGLSNFWMRRWWRTLPSYYFWFVVFVLITLVAKNLSFSKREMIQCMFFIQNFAWSPPGHFNVSWSLAIEEWFYLLYPITIFLFIRVFNAKKTFIIATLIFIVVPILLRLNFRVDGGIDAGMRKVVCFRLDAIMYGVGMALIAEFLPKVWAKRRELATLGIIGLACCAYYFYLARIQPTNEFIERNVILPAVSLSFALLFPLFTQFKAEVLPLWLSKPILATSLISYSLYLCHIPCIILVGFCYKKIAGPQVDVLSVPGVIAMWILSFAVAGLAYRFIEKPFLVIRDARFPAVRAASLTAR